MSGLDYFLSRAGHALSVDQVAEPYKQVITTVALLSFNRDIFGPAVTHNYLCINF